MKDIQNDKMLGFIAGLAFILGFVLCGISYWSLGGMLLALGVVVGILMLQIKMRKKKKKNRYHAVHWNDGHVSKDI